jgi:hypothetical protein
MLEAIWFHVSPHDCVKSLSLEGSEKKSLKNKFYCQHSKRPYNTGLVQFQASAKSRIVRGNIYVQFFPFLPHYKIDFRTGLQQNHIRLA